MTQAASWEAEAECAVELEERVAVIEREWPKLRLSFLALDRYIAYRMRATGASLEELLESLIAYCD